MWHDTSCLETGHLASNLLDWIEKLMFHSQGCSNLVNCSFDFLPEHVIVLLHIISGPPPPHITEAPSIMSAFML
jgi:hypothetical protein